MVDDQSMKVIDTVTTAVLLVFHFGRMDHGPTELGQGESVKV